MDRDKEDEDDTDDEEEDRKFQMAAKVILVVSQINWIKASVTVSVMVITARSTMRFAFSMEDICLVRIMSFMGWKKKKDFCLFVAIILLNEW